MQILLNAPLQRVSGISVPPEVVSGWFWSAVILNPIKLLFDIFNCNVFSCGLPAVGLSKLRERGEMEKVKTEAAAQFFKTDCWEKPLSVKIFI